MTVDVPGGATTTIAGPYAGAVDGLAIVDLTSDGVVDYVFAVDDQVHLVDGLSLENLWVSHRLGEGVGRHDSLIVEDLDNDGSKEIWVNAGKVGQFVFEVAAPESIIFWDGFESGDTSVWSVTSPNRLPSFRTPGRSHTNN